MQTLVFNSTTRTIYVYDDTEFKGKRIYEMDNIPTVQVFDQYYEVRQLNEKGVQIPVLRLPIANTIMVIKK